MAGRVLLAALILAPLSVQAADWQALRWGMGVPEAAAALEGETAMAVPRAWGNGLSAPFFLDGAEVAGLSFRLWPQFDAGGLRQMLFERRRGEAQPEDAARLWAGLSSSLGPPGATCRAGTSAEALWVMPEGVLHAVFLDFSTREGLVRREGAALPPVVRHDAPPPVLTPPERVERQEERERPGPDLPDPAPWRFSEPPPAREGGVPASPPVFFEAERSQLPRRLLVRLHDPGAAALARGLCDG